MDAKPEVEDSPKARAILAEPELLELGLVLAETTVVAPVSRPLIAAVISRDFIVVFVIGVFLSHRLGWFKPVGLNRMV
jgi:hypothetical protein